MLNSRQLIWQMLNLLNLDIDIPLMDLSGIKFQKCNLSNVEIKDCDITGLKINGINISELLKKL